MNYVDIYFSSNNTIFFAMYNALLKKKRITRFKKGEKVKGKRVKRCLNSPLSIPLNLRRRSWQNKGQVTISQICYRRKTFAVNSPLPEGVRQKKR